MAGTPPIIPTLPSVATGPVSVGQGQNPPPLPQLPAGTILQGAVSGQDAKGNPIVQTDTLQLVLSTRFVLTKGMHISVRLEQPLAKDALPPVRILAVDGKPAVPPAAEAAQPRPGVVQGNNPQAEQAKPVGMLLEVMTRPTGSANASARPAAEAAPETQIPARGVATEVTLSEGQKATAVLLRPAVSARAATLLTQLATQTGVKLDAASTAMALRPGLQLQVQVAQTTPAPAQTPTAQTPQPQQPSQGAASASTPSSTPAPATAETPAMQPNPQQPPATPVQQRAGYAQYAKQNPAMISGNPPASAPPSMPPAASTPPLAGQPPLASPATPVQVPSTLTPQTVDQLLARVEAQPLPQGQMAGVVMGKEPGGALIVQTRLGMFTLPQVQANNAQIGTVLTWKVDAVQIPKPAEAPLPMAGSGGLLATASQMTDEWSALDELSSLLHGMQSSMAAQTLQRMIPHVGSHLSAGLLFFMSVLRKGDISEWMGRDMVEHLERMGKGDLVQRLGNDMNALRTLFTDQPPGNWQALFFPVMIDKQLQHAQMFVKQDAQDKKEGGMGTRFVVELDLSNLGPMQLDGFVKKRQTATHFDLVLRTMEELPEQMKVDIYAIFDNAQKVTGMGGSLNFRLVQEFPVNPLEEIQKKGGDAGGILA